MKDPQTVGKIPRAEELLSPGASKTTSQAHDPQVRVELKVSPAWQRLQVPRRLLLPRRLQARAPPVPLQAPNWLSPPRLLCRAPGLMDLALTMESLSVMTLPSLKMKALLSEFCG
jgi:hypothetical protein